jgi:hypothetical protein
MQDIPFLESKNVISMKIWHSILSLTNRQNFEHFLDGGAIFFFVGGREGKTLQREGDSEECTQHRRDVRQIYQNYQPTGKGR